MFDMGRLLLRLEAKALAIPNIVRSRGYQLFQRVEAIPLEGDLDDNMSIKTRSDDPMERPTRDTQSNKVSGLRNLRVNKRVLFLS